MMKIYEAGSLFSDKEIRARLLQECMLKENFPQAKIYNPISNDEINDKTMQPTSQDIFLQDTKKIIESNIITADLDDKDLGQAMELGLAYGINYMLDVIKEYASLKAFDKINDKIPYKKVYATYSDIRQDTKGEEGIYKSVGNNMYLYWNDLYELIHQPKNNLKSNKISNDINLHNIKFYYKNKLYKGDD